MSELRGLALRGGVAKFSARASEFVLRIGSLMVLARLLEPADFGIVGMVTVVTGILSLFKEFGLSLATVQRATITHEEISTMFWVNIVVGIVLALVSLVLAPFTAAFYHEPRLYLVLIVLGFGFIFNSAGVQHAALLQRQMRFIDLAIIEVLSLLISSTISIVLAIRGYGYWALVAWSVALPLAGTILTMLQSGWVPGRPHLNPGMKSMVRFGGIVTLNSLVVYIAYNLDKILLGRFWGVDAVGIYGRAYQLATLPTDYINGATGSIAIPVLSRLQNNPERLRSYFLKGYSLVLALTIPTTAACAIFSHELIFVVFGAKWNDAVPIFGLLTPTILAFSLINPPGWLLVGSGMVGRSLKIAFVIAPVVILGCVIGLPYGAKGVALGFSAALTLWIVPHLMWSFHGTVVSFQDVMKVVSRPCISGAVAAVCALGTTSLVNPGISPLMTLLVGGAVLVAVYVWMLLFVMGQKTFYLNLLRDLKNTPSEKINALS